jgi:enoyl-CoA hydratase
MELTVIRYDVDGPIATITLNRPHYKNAQDYRLLDEFDVAMDMAEADKAVRAIVVRGSGGNFSSGHDLGTPESVEYRTSLGAEPGVESYDQFKKYNLDLLLKWRNHPKPTIAMVEGYCIYAGWMLTACLDIVFAADNALFLAGVVEYMAIPWDIGVRRAKELVFESRFISAEEAARYGVVNRVLPLKDLERETYAYARRVAENSPLVLRFAKLQMNKAQDQQGYTNALEDSLGDYVAMSGTSERGLRMEGKRRLTAVDLAVRGLKGDRFGLKKQRVKATAPRRRKSK